MAIFRRTAAVVVLGILGTGLGLAQDAKPPQAVPSDEHVFLHQFVGEWRTEGKMKDASGKEAETLGLEYDRMVLGDFWLFFVYNSQMNGKPFVGHGMIGYDPSRKKYIGTWVDSMSPYMATFEGTVDPKTRALTLETSGTDPATEKECKGRMVYQFQDAEHRSLQSFKLDESGAPKMMFELHYTKESAQSK
jgi:hypothetical protein